MSTSGITNSSTNYGSNRVTSKNQIKRISDNYQLNKIIGQGTFGSVYEA